MVRELKHTEIGDIPVDWEVQTFEETFRILSNNTLSRENLNNRGGAVRNIHYGDILTQFSEVLNCKEEVIPYVNDLSLLTSSTQLLQDGDLIIADTAEDATVGKATEVQGLGNGKLVAGLHTIPCRVKKGDFAPGWLGYYMNSHMYHNQIIPFITGIKVSSISKSAVSKTLIVIPPIEEQKMIVEILSQIDLLIQNEQKIADKLIAVKKGCLSKMFPMGREESPEIRLPEFSGPWEKCKLGKLGEFNSNGVDKKIYPDEKMVNLLNYMDVYNRKEVNSTNCHELMQVSAKDTQIKNNNIQKNDVFFTPTSETPDDIGHAMVIEENLDNTVYSYHLMRFRPYKDTFYSIFPNYCFATEPVRKQMALMAQGVQRYVLSKSQFESIDVLLPTIDEQQMISEFLSSVDKLIILHLRRGEKYIEIKSGLISMLISVNK